MAKNCPYCGMPVPDDLTYCQGCGTNLQLCRTNNTHKQKNKKIHYVEAGDTDRTIRILNIVLAVLAVIQVLIICFVTPGWFRHSDSVRDRSVLSTAIEWESR